MAATTKLDWDKDVVKHYVRRFGWLPAASAQFAASIDANRDPKYFTFCASNALDVFLLLNEGVLRRDPKTDVVSNTYFCEAKPDEFNRISQLIGAHEQGFLGDFHDMILFEDDDLTRGRDLSDAGQRYSGEVRRRLNTKERHQNFTASFPFDVINLDIYGAFFPPAGGVTSPMVRSIRKLLDLQSAAAEAYDNFGSFTLFLTAHVEAGKVNDEAFEQLVKMVERNRDTYSGFADALNSRFGTTDVTQIADDDFNGFYCLGLPKLIVGEAFDRGWSVDPKFSGLYKRLRTTSGGDLSDPYAMLAWVGKFERRVPEEQPIGRIHTPSDQEYVELIGHVTDEPEDIDAAATRHEEEVRTDLEQVAALRKNYEEQVRNRV